MKLITFLGRGGYTPVVYMQGEYRCEQTAYFPVALAQLDFEGEKITEVFAVVTPVAEEGLKDLRVELEKKGVKVTPIQIPNGHSEQEIWDIFSRITEKLNQGDHVIFDITHGFRSLPFLAFLATAYLRVAKDVKIVGIYYGAYDPNISKSEAPIIDLSSFIALLDWTTATDKFLKAGDARDLLGLLHDQSPNTPAIQSFEDSLRSVSLSLELAHPIELGVASARLNGRIPRDGSNLPKPFLVLLEGIQENYAPYALAQEQNLLDNLKQQWFVIQKYIERKKAIQTYQLAREWIISILCWEFRDGIQARHPRISAWRDFRGVREPISQALNGLLDKEKELYNTPLEYLYMIEDLPVSKLNALESAWRLISKYRNPLAHCGMDGRRDIRNPINAAIMDTSLANEAIPTLTILVREFNLL